MVASRGALGLITVSLVAVVGMAAWYGREAWEDSGSFAFLLFGIPLVCTAGALAAEMASRNRLAPVVVGVLGAVSLVWSLLTAGGIGLGFVSSSLLLLVAAMISGVDRRRAAQPLRT